MRYHADMAQERIHYPRTTAQQRKLLFQVWEETGGVERACRKAHVGKSTFYNWKPRFESDGYEALENFKSHAPKNPNRTALEIEQKVIDLRRQHPDWGKLRIANELTKANNWVQVVSPNTVRRILIDADLWNSPEAEPKDETPTNTNRTAEQPGQTVNVDLCFVPATHEAQSKLPAVSGSSGRLVVERPKDEATERQWPGRVFEDAGLDYEEAMHTFVSASEAHSQQPASEPSPEQVEVLSHEVEKRAVRQAEAKLRDERRQVRARRKQEDAAWRELRAERKTREQAYRALSKQERRQHREAKRAQDKQWQALRAQRKATQEYRKQEDEVWRQQRKELKERLAQFPIVTAWIAILVVIDNCSRQCLGLPLFVVGSKVTAEMVVQALRHLLPSELQFLISDRGTHFTAQVFAQLTRELGFTHVLIARHRPESNGIAERFVRTLKDWSLDKRNRANRDRFAEKHRKVSENGFRWRWQTVFCPRRPLRSAFGVADSSPLAVRATFHGVGAHLPECPTRAKVGRTRVVLGWA